MEKSEMMKKFEAETRRVMTEAKMVDQAVEKLKRARMTYVTTEIPFLSRCIDVVAIDRDGLVVTFEFKLNDYKQAVRQARDHALGADKAYICMPMKKVTQKILDYVRESGVGLCSFDNEIGIIYHVEPRAGRKVGAFREMLIDNFWKARRHFYVHIQSDRPNAVGKARATRLLNRQP